MSWPEAFQPNETLGIDQILPTVPRDFGERFTLDWRAARSPDRWLRYEMRMQELYDDALDKLRTATGQNLPNPFALPPERSGARIAIGGGLGIASAEAEGASRRDRAMKDVVTALDSARELAPDLPDPREFDGKVTAESTEMRKAAQRAALASYGAGGLGAFLGATAGEMSHPAQIATLPLGGTYAASSIARVGLLRFIGRAAVTEGAVAAAAQIGVEALDAPYQARLATDGPGSGNEFGDRIERVLFAAAGGALIGMGLAGLVGAARGVSRRIKPTLDEADALKVAERAVYGSERNPLGPDGVNAHTAALNKAEVEVSAGRHADVREIVREEVARSLAVRPKPEPAPDAKPPTERPAIQDADAMGAAFGDAFVQGRLANSPEQMGAVRLAVRDVAPEWAAARQAMETTSPDAARNLSYALGDAIAFVSRATKEGGDVAERLAVERADAATQFLARAFYRDPDFKGGMAAREVVYERLRAFADEMRGERLPAPASTFDILDSAAATRPIADNAPIPPEKPPTGMKEAKADEARAMVLQKDFEITMADGTKRLASEIMAEADDKVRAAKVVAECAAGGAIG